MAVYVVGGEADCFVPVSGQTYDHTTSVGRFISTASRGAMNVVQAVSEIELFAPANYTEAYIHMYLYQEIVAGAVDDWIQIKKLNGDPAFRLGLNADGTWDADKYDGAVWDNMDTTSTSVVSVGAAAIDIYIKVNAVVGEFRIFKDGTEILTFIGDTSIDNLNFGRIHWKGQVGSANELNVSQVIVANEATIGWILATLHPTGNGANTSWTGSFTDIDEFILNTADYIEAIATNLVETSTISAINGAYATYNVKAMCVAMRASNDSGSVVSDLQAALRVGSTNYFSPNLALPKDGQDYSRQYIWETNPATSAAWAQAAVNAAQIGVRSV